MNPSAPHHHVNQENTADPALPYSQTLLQEISYIPVVQLPRTTVFVGKRRSIVTHESQCSLLNTNRSSDESGKPETVSLTSEGASNSTKTEKETNKGPNPELAADNYIEFISRKKWWGNALLTRAKTELKKAVSRQNSS